MTLLGEQIQKGLIDLHGLLLPGGGGDASNPMRADGERLSTLQRIDCIRMRIKALQFNSEAIARERDAALERAEELEDLAESLQMEIDVLRGLRDGDASSDCHEWRLDEE